MFHWIVKEVSFMVFPQNSMKEGNDDTVYARKRQTCLFCPEAFGVLSEDDKGRAQ